MHLQLGLKRGLKLLAETDRRKLHGHMHHTHADTRHAPKVTTERGQGSMASLLDPPPETRQLADQSANPATHQPPDSAAISASHEHTCICVTLLDAEWQIFRGVAGHLTAAASVQAIQPCHGQTSEGAILCYTLYSDHKPGI